MYMKGLVQFMTLQQLRYAVTVADCKSMNKAATQLFVTQPSLSNMIKELENEIHIKIFSRSSRGIAITPEGEEFLGYARQMLDHYRLIEEKYVDHAFYFAEEVLSTMEYKQIIKANDRATMLNLMVGMNGYTLCCGLISDKLNGGQYAAVPLKIPQESSEVMTIGYIKRKGFPLSEIAKKYLHLLVEMTK